MEGRRASSSLNSLSLMVGLACCAGVIIGGALNCGAGGVPLFSRKFDPLDDDDVPAIKRFNTSRASSLASTSGLK